MKYISSKADLLGQGQYFWWTFSIKVKKLHIVISIKPWKFSGRWNHPGYIISDLDITLDTAAELSYLDWFSNFWLCLMCKIRIKDLYNTKYFTEI